MEYDMSCSTHNQYLRATIQNMYISIQRSGGEGELRILKTECEMHLYISVLEPAVGFVHTMMNIRVFMKVSDLLTS
jgi:hypothetical protein